MKRVWIFALSCLLLPTAASAQVAWDAPSLIHPGAPSGLSIVLLEPHPGNELGAMAIWRNAEAPMGIGIRGGIAEGPGGDAAGLIGLDISGSLNSPSSTGEPRVIWWSGAGLGFGNEVVASFPLGLSLGWRASEGDVTFLPNVGGHVVLDVASGPGDDLDIDGAVDLGMDVGFRSGFMVRFGAAIGGRDALAIGVRLPR